MSELIIDKITTRDGSNVGAIVVADIDELLLLNTNKEINTTAIVKDNNRGGVFIYDGAQSGVNNGGTIFNGWVRQYDGAVNVKWFGAVGDGVTDDTSAIQAAIDAASPNGSVFIPNGNYSISDSINVTGPITIFGENTGSQVNLAGTGIIQTNTTKSIFVLVASTDNYEWGTYAAIGVVFRDLSLSGVDNSNKASSAISCDLSVNAGDFHVRENVFSNLTIRFCDTGIDLTGTVYLNSFTSVSVMWCTTGIKIARGLASENGGQNRFTTCTLTGGTVGLSYQEDGSSGSLSLFGCTLSENAYGLKIGEDSAFFIYGSMFENNSVTSIYVEIASEAQPNSDAGRCIMGNKFISSPKSIHINKTAVAWTSLVNFPLFIEANTFLDAIAVESSTAITQKTLVLGAANSGVGSAGTFADSQLVNFLGHDSRKIAEAVVPTTGLLVGTTDTQTLSNKTLYGDVTVTNGNYINNTLEITTNAVTNGGKNSILFSELGGTLVSSIVGYNNSYGAGVGGSLILSSGGADVAQITASGLLSRWDNGATLGNSTHRWSNLYLVNAPIVTSDDRMKNYLTIEDKEVEVAKELKTKMKKFTMKDFNGDKARIHYGTSAQEVKATFEKHGLVAEDYALLCYDEWEAEYEQVIDTEAILNEEGSVITEATYKDGELIKEAGNRYGIRYTELLCFIIGAM